jgi:hypothetical protein
MKINRFQSAGIVITFLFLAAIPLPGFAQESCSADDVDAALDQLSCVAEGAYISVATAVDSVVERCSGFGSEQACRRCFRRSSARLLPAFKALSRAELLERNLALELRAELRMAEDDTCLYLEEPPTQDPPAYQPPPPAPTAFPTPSEAGSGNQFRQPPRPRR